MRHGERLVRNNLVSCIILVPKASWLQFFLLLVRNNLQILTLLSPLYFRIMSYYGEQLVYACT